jgi:hypothetical protein
VSISAINNAYQFKSLANDNIMIGDAADADFHPKFTLNRWNGECWLKLDFDDSQILGNQQNVNLEENTVKWSSPLFDFHYYPLSQTDQHEDGGLEFEIILKVKPQQNTLTFPIQTRGFKFYKQRPLTQELNPADCTELSETYARLKNGAEYWRPENVVNSYAVYHDSKRDNKYKTGKAFHIYRPKLTDTDGKTAWAEFNVDAEQTGQLTITLPQSFLDSAKYPIIIDPTFGYTSIGASQGNNGGVYLVACKANMPENGTITEMQAYFGCSSSGNAKTVLYSDNGGTPNALLATSYELAISAGNGWRIFTISHVNSGGSVQLWLAPFANITLLPNYDSGDAHRMAYDQMTYATFPNPFVEDGNAAQIYSIYATYTTGATLQTVTDALSLGDAVLRNKTLMLIDSLGLADFLYGNKALFLGDSASLSELVTVIINEAIKQVSDSVNIADIAAALKTLKATDMVTLADVALTPSRVLQALDAIGLADNCVVNKVLQITETVSLAEVVQVGAGGVKKTRLFLVLGDLAVQLTSD